jgi:hypothetical protein
MPIHCCEFFCQLPNAGMPVLVLVMLGLRPVLKPDLAIQSPTLLIEEFYKLVGDFSNARLGRHFGPPMIHDSQDARRLVAAVKL